MPIHKSREWLQAKADGPIICATHFNYWGVAEGYDVDDFIYMEHKWLKKEWDTHHEDK